MASIFSNQEVENVDLPEWFIERIIYYEPNEIALILGLLLLRHRHYPEEQFGFDDLFDTVNISMKDMIKAMMSLGKLGIISAIGRSGCPIMLKLLDRKEKKWPEGTTSRPQQEGPTNEKTILGIATTKTLNEA